MVAPRKASASATGGRMLNPSVEPASRRESARERRDSEGKERRNSASRPKSRGSTTRSSVGGGERSGSVVLAGEPTTKAAALEARNQRRSIGLKRLSVNTHMKETLIHTLEDVARGVVGAIQTETTGIDKLQTIMTEAKEKGLGVSNLFHFFLLQSDGTKRVSVERKPRESKERPEEAAGPENTPPPKRESATGGVFKETQASKTRVEASRSSRAGKKKSIEGGHRTSTSKRDSGDSGRAGPAKVEEPDTTNPKTAEPATTDPATTDSSAKDPATNDGGRPPFGRRKSSMSRRSSSVVEAMMRDRLITSGSFQHGLKTLGFKISEEETAAMFQHLDTNGDGAIDLAEFTRFCLEIPSMTWKAERARRGVLGVETGRGLDKAALDMANEAVSAGDNGEGEGGAPAKLAPMVDLGKVVFKGEKFFWRTKDLIEVVVQLNETKGFLAVSTFHTDRLQVYPIIFIDPAKIPSNATAEAEILKDIKSKQLAAKTDLAMGGSGGGGNADAKKETGEPADGSGEEDKLSEKAHMAYIGDYVVHRLTMPDESGNLLQPDVTRPDEQVNPDLPEDGKGDSASKTKRGSAVARPGLMRTTFDEWDTLLYPNPPSRVRGAPEFAKTKKRESYFQEFCNVTEKFQENRVKAHRLSDEAASLAMQVANTLAPLSHSASAPVTSLLDTSAALASDDAANPANPRPGSGRLVLSDDIAAKRNSSTRKSLLESQSEPALRPSAEAVAV